MIRDSIAQVRPDPGPLMRLLLAFVAWRRRAARRQRREADRLSDHLRKDIGFSRWDPERQVTDWLYRG
jgi:uncharacterized protein YjiS (DUF1127 family)